MNKHYALFALFYALLLLQPVVMAQVAEEPPAVTTDYGQVAYIPIDGVIDRIRFRLLKRALERADEQAIDTLVISINTDGGEVFYAREMLKLILDQPQAGRNTIALIDYRAISAGALIAYGHQQIYISDTATIGDIGVIFRAQDGSIKFASEKIETVIRALLAQASEQNGWPRGLLLKMTARNQKLYRVTLPDGRFEYIIQDDFAEFLAAHPEIDKDKDSIVYRGSNRLLTLTGREATALAMATGQAANTTELYRQLIVDSSTVIDLSPGLIERLAALFAGWALLFAGLALLFIVFELKTPGVGLWALFGAVFATLFLIAQFTLDLIDYLEIALILLGLALLLVELLTLFSGGLLGLSGAALIFTGLVLAFLPNEFDFDFSNPEFVDALTSAGLQSLFAIAIMTAGVIAFIALVPNGRLSKRMAVTAEIKAQVHTGIQLEPSATDLIGRSGICRDALRPGGIVIIDGHSHNARARYGAALEPGQAIKVTAVEFGELLVEATDSPC